MRLLRALSLPVTNDLLADRFARVLGMTKNVREVLEATDETDFGGKDFEDVILSR